MSPFHVMTILPKSADQCWSVIVFFFLLKYHSAIYNKDVTFFVTSKVWVVDGIFVLFSTRFGSICHTRTFIHMV